LKSANFEKPGYHISGSRVGRQALSIYPMISNHVFTFARIGSRVETRSFEAQG
jgi:23S rRNA A1618 N6-methylase RlmF